MYKFLISLILYCFASTDIAVSQVPGHHCEWISNVTENTIEMAGHQYMIIEECLYYNLSQNSDKVQGKYSSMITLPPTKRAGDKINIVIKDLVISQLWINELWKEMNIEGFMNIEWNDWRLTWSPQNWKIDSMPIKSRGHIWVPDLFTGWGGTTSRNNDYTSFKELKTSYQGDITGRLQFRMQAFCEVEYKNFPSDKIMCNFFLHSGIFSDLISFDLQTSEARMDPYGMQTNWDVQSRVLKQFKRDDTDFRGVNLSVNVGRKSTTLTIEITLPIFVCAILVVIAPLFGPFKFQLSVKLFTILLHFLAFQFLVTKTPQIGFGDATPNIYLFYQFSLGMTVVSLLYTVILYALCGATGPKLPAPHRLSLLAKAFNKWCYCRSFGNEPDAITENGIGSAGSKGDWMEVFGFLNAVTSLIFTLVYVTGVLSIYL